MTIERDTLNRLISVDFKLASIAESLKIFLQQTKASTINLPEFQGKGSQRCKNCGTYKAPDVKWFSPGFCSKKCVMELAEKLAKEDNIAPTEEVNGLRKALVLSIGFMDHCNGLSNTCEGGSTEKCAKCLIDKAKKINCNNCKQDKSADEICKYCSDHDRWEGQL